MSSSESYRIVKLASGAHSIHSLQHAETFHPVIGPVAEAEALYVRQLNLVDRIRLEPGEFVVWDVGLGAAANPITLLRAAAGSEACVRIVSFDHTLEPLEFALRHTAHLEYLRGFESPLERLLKDGGVSFKTGKLAVEWEFRLADFPSLISSPAAAQFPKPHTIMYDAFSPGSNAVMWTQRVFETIYNLLDPARACALPTYSRSTMMRVTLLLAGFFVGVGHPTGEKEETTVAANSRSLISEPLNAQWLKRARRSTSAEPMWTPVYRQEPLSDSTWERLCAHPQFHAA